ncbi:septation protein IspZ [Rhodopseudomonas palustris]|uniref:inner membrane-spanning protein YciB n=1 Tax=Rhodopseudomonas palustris TaxID=1076 RepID=UPI0020CC5B9F|nr:septation protein IspZ [Rhodopseudomonas palustris]MCP9625794.1 septation protein IspZ [Rhodopseudomonas palustris]
MKAVFSKLGNDFFSTIIFVVLYFSTGNVALATVVAVIGAVGQFAYARIKGFQLDVMAYASLAMVIVLGGATLLTNDPRFVLIKPSIGHIAVGAIMLRRDWMLRYVPPVVATTIPDYVRVSGYFWAILMIALGAGVIAAAMTGDIKTWTFYVMIIAPAVKVAAVATQYLVFRLAIRSRRRGEAAAAVSMAE